SCRFFSCPKFSPDGKQIAFAEPERPALHLWDVAEGKAIHHISLKEWEQVVGFSPDGRALVSWRRASGSVRLWDTAAGKECQAGHVGGGVDAVLLSPDGKRVAVRKGQAVEFRGLMD